MRVLIFCTAFSMVQAQPTALQLQESGHQRITKAIDNFRRTGDPNVIVGDLRQAEIELDASQRAFLAAGQLAPASWSLVRLADCRRMQNQWQEAMQMYQRALALAKQAGHAGYQAKALIGIARTEELGTREFGAAAFHVAEAVRISENLPDKSIYLEALEEKAAVELTQLQALPAMQTLDRLQEALKGRPEDARTFFAAWYRADVYYKLSEPCRNLAQRSPDLCRQTLDLAKENYEKARAIATRLGYKALAAQMVETSKGLETILGMSASSSKTGANLAKTPIFEPKKPSDVLATEFFTSGTQPLPGELLAMTNGLPQNDALGTFIAAQALETQGKADAALEGYLKAIAKLEADRKSLNDESSRGTFIEDKISFYDRPILIYLERRRYAEAFDLLERARSRGMVELLASRSSGSTASVEKSLFAQSVSLKAQIGLVQREILTLASTGSGAANSAKIAGLQTRVGELEAAQEKLTQRMKREAPRLLDMPVSTSIPLAELQGIMRRDKFDVIHYMVAYSGVFVWHIGPSGIQVRNVFLPLDELRRKVEGVRRTAADPNETFDEKRARELYLFLIQPVIGFVESKQLVIVPHDDLHQLPFQTLISPDGESLGERFLISYAPSATVVARLRKAPNLSGGKLFAAAMPALDDTREEVIAIAKHYPGRAMVMDKTLVKESELGPNVANQDVVHLAVHGEFKSSTPLLSYLQLGADGISDGRFTAAKMFGLPLERATLVTLSACETGESKVTGANELLGMQRALLFAGAQSLLLSSWKVNSKATSVWMQKFYEEAQSKPIAESARLALQFVKSNPAYRHPVYWGAFQLVGK